MKVSLRSNKGFSLVELMVVVAIIGILAAIAIPNFQRFTAKSKQAEAKADLSAIYTAERAFQSEWQTYEPSFTMVGYAPSGNYRYQHGLNGTAAAPGNYTGPVAVGGDVSTVAYCSQNGTTGAYTNGCNVAFLAAQAPTMPTIANTAPGTFQAGAGAIIAGGTTQDQWLIDESKTFSNTNNGLP